jgi:hypothetical protein
MERIQNLSGQVASSGSASGNVFGHIKMAPPDPILGTTLAYKADKDSKKINLGVGAYRDNNE